MLCTNIVTESFEMIIPLKRSSDPLCLTKFVSPITLEISSVPFSGRIGTRVSELIVSLSEILHLNFTISNQLHLMVKICKVEVANEIQNMAFLFVMTMIVGILMQPVEASDEGHSLE